MATNSKCSLKVILELAVGTEPTPPGVRSAPWLNYYAGIALARDMLG